ncbi:MAG: PD-(D/E)XK nuclease family protein [Thermoplasmata archaeon]|nr:PD-(D/E)XK nuclease family protein [Thermoplasmata archaeon]
MKKEIREVKTINKEKIIQITTLDERWYAKSVIDSQTNLPRYIFYPSVTWISSYYPKGIAFYKWLANKGWEESEAIKISAGEKGSKIHQATQMIDDGKEVAMEDKFINPTTMELEELTPEEYKAVMDFTEWLDITKPELLANEITVFGDDYAGTIDRIYRIDGQIWIVDIKTGQNIWEEYKLQLSAYSHANINYKELGITDKEWQNRRLAILQIGYHRNQRGYKFTEVEDKYNLFRMARQIWENENPNAKPDQASYPLRLMSKVRAKKVAKTNRIKKI